MVRLCIIRARHCVMVIIIMISSCTPLRRCWGWWQFAFSHADRLESEDYGIEHPIASNAIPSGRQQNYCVVVRSIAKCYIRINYLLTDVTHQTTWLPGNGIFWSSQSLFPVSWATRWVTSVTNWKYLGYSSRGTSAFTILRLERYFVRRSNLHLIDTRTSCITHYNGLSFVSS